MKIIESPVHRDGRGLFLETWKGNYTQGNLSISRPYVLRGLHYQIRKPQAKFMTCAAGSAIVCGLNLRTHLHELVLLDDIACRSVLIPELHAVGFLALERGATMVYALSGQHDPTDDNAIDALDPDLAIQWPKFDYVRSPRDRVALRLRDVPRDRLP